MPRSHMTTFIISSINSGTSCLWETFITRLLKNSTKQGSLLFYSKNPQRLLMTWGYESNPKSISSCVLLDHSWLPFRGQEKLIQAMGVFSHQSPTHPRMAKIKSNQIWMDKMKSNSLFCILGPIVSLCLIVKCKTINSIEVKYHTSTKLR